MQGRVDVGAVEDYGCSGGGEVACDAAEIADRAPPFQLPPPNSKPPVSVHTMETVITNDAANIDRMHCIALRIEI